MPANTARPTIRDVAERAGVSKSLVSLVLRGSPNVSADRRAAVDRAIAELGYRPNAAARTLREGRSRAIGVLLNDVRHPWFIDLLDGLISVLEAEGRHVVLSGGGRLNRRTDDSVLRGFLELEADGFILAGTQANSPVITEIASSVPTVTVGWRDIDLPRVDAVANDDLIGAALATRHLIELGHRRIGLIVGRRDTTSGRERLSGYIRALREAAIPLDNALIHAGHFEPETGATSCRELLDLPNPPSAIFVANHEATLGVLRVTAERNIAIPDDVSLLCYEDMPWFEWHRPAISIVDNGARDLANLAVDRLLHRMDAKTNGHDGVREYRVGARLVKRDSCRAFGSPSAGSPAAKSSKSKHAKSKTSAPKA